MRDWILALIALFVMIGSLAIIAFEVPSPDLVIVIILACAMAAYDVISSLIKKR